MGAWELGATRSDLLRRAALNNEATGDATPGMLRWVDNKGTDFGTTMGGITNAAVSGVVDTENIDGTGHWEIYAHNETGSAIVVGNIYNLTVSGNQGEDPQVVAFTNAANTNHRQCVVGMSTTAADAWGWFAIAGDCLTVSTEGTVAISAGNSLIMDVDDSNSGVVALISDGGSVENDNTVAIAMGSNSTSGSVTNIRAYLIGKRVVVTT